MSSQKPLDSSGDVIAFPPYFMTMVSPAREDTALEIVMASVANWL